MARNDRSRSSDHLGWSGAAMRLNHEDNDLCRHTCGLPENGARNDRDESSRKQVNPLTSVVSCVLASRPKKGASGWEASVRRAGRHGQPCNRGRAGGRDQPGPVRSDDVEIWPCIYSADGSKVWNPVRLKLQQGRKVVLQLRALGSGAVDTDTDVWLPALGVTPHAGAGAQIGRLDQRLPPTPSADKLPTTIIAGSLARVSRKGAPSSAPQSATADEEGR